MVSDTIVARQRGVVWVLVLGLAITVFAVGTATAQTDSVPDCATVSYDGDGTDTAPYEIASAAELACLGNETTATELNDSFALVADIDASGTATWHEGRGFDPIGQCLSFNLSQCADPVFNGTLDGNGHAVTGLTVDRPDENESGLFGAIGPSGTVLNLTLDAVDIRGGSFNRVGGLAGINVGTVRRARVTGTVTGENFNVGGVVGSNDGDVRQSAADATVEGVAAVGGLVGNTAGNSTVSESYATGDVTAEQRAGGLLGRNIGLIADSYATGNATATEGQAGGLTGSTQRNGTVTRSFAVGAVAGESPTGGVSGRLGAGAGQIGAELPQGENETAAIVDAAWDTETTGQTEAVGERAPGNGSVRVESDGLTTAAMTGEGASDELASLAFGDIWETTDDYPVLAWQAHAGTDNQTTEQNGDTEQATPDNVTDNGDEDTTDDGPGQLLLGVAVLVVVVAVLIVAAARGRDD